MGGAFDCSIVPIPRNTDSWPTSFQKRDESLHGQLQQTSAAVRFTCPLCSLSYKRVADLNRHMKQKHCSSLMSLTSSCRQAVTIADEGPLNLTLKDASLSRPDSHLYCENTFQIAPLDLSVTSRPKTLKWNECSGGLFDNASGGRPTSSMQKPTPFMLSDSMTKQCHVMSQNSTLLSSPAIPSFNEGFTRFIENTYSPLLKPYFGGIVGRNTTAVRSENKSSHRCINEFDMHSVFSEVSRSVVTNDKGELSAVADNNNNTLNYSFATGSDIITDGPDLLRPTALTVAESGNECLGGSKDGGAWGKCPLCPFVCPHPLVMRRHLDIHEEPELQRTTHSRQEATESICKPSCEVGAAGKRGGLFQASSNPNFFFDVAGKASRIPSTMLSSSAWRSTSTTGSDGTAVGDVSVTPGWLQGGPLAASDLASGGSGKSASWNSTPALMARSLRFQTAPPVAAAPFPFSSQAQGKTDDSWRELYERSRSMYEKQHAAEVHPACGDVMTLTSSAANTVMPWWNSIRATPSRQWPAVPLPPTAAGWWRGWHGNEQLWSAFSGGLQSATVNNQSAAVTTVHSTPAKTAHTHAADFKVTLL